MLKKCLSFMVVGIAALALPMVVNAAKIVGSCGGATLCENGKCRETCKIRVEENTEKLNLFTGEFVFTPADKGKIVEVNAGDLWKNESGNSANFMFSSAEGVTAANFDLVTVVLEVEQGIKGCSLQVKNPNVGTNVEIEIETTTQTQTGAALPIAIIGCGACAAVVIYATTKKSKKIYKI